MRKIVIIGGNHHNTLGVIRSLGIRNDMIIEAIIITPTRRSFVLKSRYINHGIILPDINYLKRYLISTANEEKKIIISCSDEVSEFLDQNKNELQEYFILPGCLKQGQLSFLMNKLNILTKAKECGLTTPTHYNNLDLVTYPCIAKPKVSCRATKNDIVICNEKEQLSSYFVQNADKIFIEEYIDKKEEFQFIGASINYGEKVIIPGMSNIIRSVSNTNTGFLQYHRITEEYIETYNKTVSLIKSCKYTGLFSVEFIRSKNNIDYFLEINFRNDGNAYCVTASGVNLPMLYIKACSGIDYKDEILNVKNITVMPEFQDFKLVVQRKLNLFTWVRDIKKTDSFLVYNKEDKGPFLYFILYKLFK